MPLESPFHALSMILQVCLVDLVLSGDNAVVIALACRALPARELKQAMFYGTGAAIGMRVLLTGLISMLLPVPLIKLIGAVLLLFIAVRLLTEEEHSLSPEAQEAPSRLWDAVMTILVADLVMSLDNVVALAAVSQGSTFYLVVGLLLSVPLLMYGSNLLTRWMRDYPLLIPTGGALLGYVAGDIAMSDPLIAQLVLTQSPALTVVMPFLGAIYVVLQSRIIRERRQQLPRPVWRQKVVKPAVIAVNIPLSAEPVAVSTVRPVEIAAAKEVPTLAADRPAVEAKAKVEVPPVAPIAPRSSSGISAAIPIVGVVLALALIAVVFLNINGAVVPKPQEDSAYVCPGDTALVYFRPGRGPIRIVSSNGEIRGSVDYSNEISWDNLQQATDALHFRPPDRIETTDAKTVTINGGSFAQTQCTLRK